MFHISNYVFQLYEIQLLFYWGAEKLLFLFSLLIYLHWDLCIVSTFESQIIDTLKTTVENLLRCTCCKA